MGVEVVAETESEFEIPEVIVSLIATQIEAQSEKKQKALDAKKAANAAKGLKESTSKLKKVKNVAEKIGKVSNKF